MRLSSVFCLKGSDHDEPVCLPACKEGGLEPNLLSFNSVVDALAHTGRWKEAMEVMNTLYRRGLQPDVITYTGLITVGTRYSVGQCR